MGQGVQARDADIGAPGFEGFHAVGLDVAHGLENLVEKTGKSREFGLCVARDLAHAFAKPRHQVACRKESRDRNQR